MKILFKFQVNRMKIEDFRITTLVDLGPMLTFWSMLTLKIFRWLNSVIWNINPLQISSQWDENWRFQKFHQNCWPLACDDLLVHVDHKNNWLVEFSDPKYKSSSNFKSIGWKLRFLEISPKLLTFGICWHFDLKNNKFLPYDKLHHVVKFCEDRFKIVTCRR